MGNVTAHKAARNSAEFAEYKFSHKILNNFSGVVNAPNGTTKPFIVFQCLSDLTFGTSTVLSTLYSSNDSNLSIDNFTFAAHNRYNIAFDTIHIASGEGIFYYL